MQTPDEWLADFEAKVADLQQKATEFKTNVEAAGATERSESVTVTVAASGALLDLKLEDAALRKSADELATEILTLTRKARQNAAVGVAQAFQPLGGDAGVVQRIPVSDPAEPHAPAPKRPAARDDDDFGDEPVVLRDTDKW